MIKPKPIYEEVAVDPMAHIVSRTDRRGVIIYANEAFAHISGYERDELEGNPHNLVRHPYMPKIIFKLMWDRILNKKNIHAFVKNLRKDGKFYWVVTDFETIIDKDSGEVTGFYAFRKTAPKKGVEEISKLYQKLVEIETKSGMAASEKYLVDFLKSKKIGYDDYINELLEGKERFISWFGKLKKLF